MKKYAIVAALFFSVSTAFSQTPQNNVEYYYMTPRTVDLIDTIFPFDVAMRTADSTEVMSNKIMKKGRVTVLAFWLTTCYPCKIEFQEYMKNWEAWKKEADFDFFAVSTDFPKNWPAFKKQAPTYPWTTVIDYNREFGQFLPGGLNGLPQVFLYDQNGKLVYHHRKYSMGDEHLLFAEIKKLMPPK